jgi:hypothetical protein
MKHLMLKGWLNTACGLAYNKEREIAQHENDVSCRNCFAFYHATKPIRAWNQCKPLSLRKLYLERAGIEPERVYRIMKVGMWSAMDKAEQKKIKRQMQDNPELARLMGLDVLSIAAGSELDQRGKFNYIGYKHSFCFQCGANAGGGV